MSVSKNLGRVRLFWRGLFDRSIQYKFLDVVSYNGSSYLVINESDIPLGTLPTDINYWSLIAEKGNKGDNGDSFEIKKTYPTIVDMQNDFSNPLLIEGDFVIITSVNHETDPDNGRLYVKGSTEFDFITDLSGSPGIKGDKGDPATISIGITTTGVEGSNATVTNSGTNVDAILNFSIPRGNKGEKGDKGDTGLQGLKGDQGIKGDTGRTSTITVGTVTTGLPSSSVTVTNSGTNTDAIFNFTIPKGEVGAKGDQGVQGIQGIKGDKGDKGDIGEKGDTGSQGIKGEQGIQGNAGTITVGTVSTGLPNSTVTVTNSGTPSNAILNFSIPKGDKGDKGNIGDTGIKGDTGRAATVAIGTVNTGSPSSTATVTNSGTVNDAVLNFSIPKGEKGDTGLTGSKGDIGLDGKAATIKIGTVSQSSDGLPKVTNSGTESDAVFNFELVKGDQGIQGLKGDKGDTGNSISNVEINSNGHMIITIG